MITNKAEMTFTYTVCDQLEIEVHFTVTEYDNKEAVVDEYLELSVEGKDISEDINIMYVKKNGEVISLDLSIEGEAIEYYWNNK